MEIKWLDWAKQLQAIAQAGLTYSTDKYDLERFQAIREISVEMLAQQSQVDQQIVRELFANETGYATPKVDVRAVVFKDNQILMVKEEIDQLWALPGGWGDIGLTPSEVAVKEVREEAGLIVEATKLIALMDKKKHPHPPSAYHVYKVFIQCEILDGAIHSGMETLDVGFFSKDHLPQLSTERNTWDQIQHVFDYLENPDKVVYFD